jgi:DNA-directed RNA polymerase subunit M/transcription elongation factor TFIIS
MENIFHKKIQTIIANKKNRQNVYNFLDKIISNKGNEKDDIIYFILYEILVEWQICPKLDELYNFIKDKKFWYFHDSFNKIRVEIRENDNFIMNPPTVEEGVIECYKCHGNRTFSFSKQTRSGDEACTVFVRCADCGNQFKM